MKLSDGHCLYEGRVVHQRYGAPKHRLSYQVISAYLNIDDLHSLDTPLLSINRFNLFGFYEKDHMDEGYNNLSDFVSQLLEANGEKYKPGKKMVLAYPRFLGHAFNPLTIFFCHNQQEELRTIIYQVRNTFGQRHHYLVRADELQTTQSHSCEKQLYVSPFLAMDCIYHFTIRPPEERALVVIRQSRNNKPLLTASFVGKQLPIKTSTLLRLGSRYFQTGTKVLGSIHWEALKLWWKGAELQPRPEPPKRPVTVINNTSSHVRD